MQKSLLAIVFTLGGAVGAIGGGAVAASGDQIIEANPHGEATAEVLACAADCLLDGNLLSATGEDILAGVHREDALAVSIHADGKGDDLTYPWSGRWLMSLAPKDVPPNSRVLSYVE